MMAFCYRARARARGEKGCRVVLYFVLGDAIAHILRRENAAMGKTFAWRVASVRAKEGLEICWSGPFGKQMIPGPSPPTFAFLIGTPPVCTGCVLGLLRAAGLCQQH
ncbi:hypothetical protein V8C37DRAFT_219448 [Trichoderma ceciliae]